jgi:hypothetical protein
MMVVVLESWSDGRRSRVVAAGGASGKTVFVAPDPGPAAGSGKEGEVARRATSSRRSARSLWTIVSAGK